jgi:hypothetical protein
VNPRIVIARKPAARLDQNLWHSKTLYQSGPKTPEVESHRLSS